MLTIKVKNKTRRPQKVYLFTNAFAFPSESVSVSISGTNAEFFHNYHNFIKKIELLPCSAVINSTTNDERCDFFINSRGTLQRVIAQVSHYSVFENRYGLSPEKATYANTKEEFVLDGITIMSIDLEPEQEFEVNMSLFNGQGSSPKFTVEKYEGEMKAIRIEKLKEELIQCLNPKVENYERAAVIRDQLADLQK